MRLFIALELPEEAKKEILRLQDLLPEFKGKKTEKENLHLTLKFLGEVEPENLIKIKEALRKIKMPKFKSSLGELGVFSPKHVKIIWARIKGAEKLQEEIDKQLVLLFPKENRFMGHVTIGRVRALGERKDFLEKIKNIKTKWMEFEVSKFVLKKSILGEQVVYEDLEEFELVD